MTRREIIVLVLSVMVMIVLAFIPQQTIDKYELFCLFGIIGPLGFMVATDPERIKKG